MMINDILSHFLFEEIEFANVLCFFVFVICLFLQLRPTEIMETAHVLIDEVIEYWYYFEKKMR